MVIWSPLFTALLREGFPPQCYGDGTQHWTDEINNSILVTHTHSRREEDTAPCRATRELNLKAEGTAEAVGGKLCSSRWRRWCPWEDVMGLFEQIHGLAGNWSCYLEMSRTNAWSSWEEGRAEREESMLLGHSRLPSPFSLRCWGNTQYWAQFPSLPQIQLSSPPTSQMLPCVLWNQCHLLPVLCILAACPNPQITTSLLSPWYSPNPSHWFLYIDVYTGSNLSHLNKETKNSFSFLTLSPIALLHSNPDFQKSF